MSITIRRLVLVYGITTYAIGMAGMTLFMLFVGGWSFMPAHIDSFSTVSFSTALTINTFLVLLFGVQHSVMARQGFKKWLLNFIPKAAERATYVLLSGLALIALCVFWQPAAGVVWDVQLPAARLALTGLQLVGWTILLSATFMINHFELFGLQQAFYFFKDATEPKEVFRERLLYKVVRHPIQLGVLLGIWATPTMTVSHAMLSVGFTLYILIGLFFEERDLMKIHGETYANYRRRVPMFLPMIGRLALKNQKVSNSNTLTPQ